MKQLIAVNSNGFFAQTEGEKPLQIDPCLEIVIIHTSGKDHEIKGSKIESTHKLEEARLIVSPNMLEALITDLKLHQKQLRVLQQNAGQINALIRHLTEADESKPEDHHPPHNS